MHVLTKLVLSVAAATSIICLATHAFSQAVTLTGANPNNFTVSGCTATSATGRASVAGGHAAGTFIAGATSCTPVIQITGGNTGIAPNGWACSMTDITNPTDSMPQTATTYNSATFSGTVSIFDKLSFLCEAY
jgi:hypothetical protein